MSEAKYEIGQVVYHKKYNYRGVVIQVDDTFQMSEDLDEEVVVTDALRRAPWYRVLVNRAKHEAYVAERHLAPDLSEAPVDNPAVGLYFDEFHGTYYLRTRMVN